MENENITDSIILNSFKENNIVDFYASDYYHYSIKNNDKRHIIGRDFRLTPTFIDLVCKIINGNINYLNAWFLLSEDFYLTVFNACAEINYDKFIISFNKVETEILNNGNIDFKPNIIIFNKMYKKISKDEFILYKENISNNISNKKIKLD